MISGINHITLSVVELDRSFAFYSEILGFKPLMKNNKSAYFLAGDLWFCIEQDPSARKETQPEYTHIAFSVDQNEFLKFTEKVKNAGVVLFKENKSEGDSLYFLDPDGHKLEIHVGDWKSRIEIYKKRNDPSFKFFDI
ncbi:MAG: VOC family protein [Rhizobacter sp.]|nr:VOC family protein [Bacteriovorax sp.]